MVCYEQHPSSWDSIDPEHLSSEVSSVQHGADCERVATRLGVETERILAYLVRMGLDLRNSRIDVLADHLFRESDDAITHRTECRAPG